VILFNLPVILSKNPYKNPKTGEVEADDTVIRKREVEVPETRMVPETVEYSVRGREWQWLGGSGINGERRSRRFEWWWLEGGSGSIG
jgi:hypothetical protein